MFGTNDFPCILDAESGNAVSAALEDFVNAYQSLDSVHRVYIQTSIKQSGSAAQVQIADGVLRKIQRETADRLGVTRIDQYPLTRGYYDVMLHVTDDGLHPTDAGTEPLANAVFSILTGMEYIVMEPPVSDAGVVYVSGNGSNDNDGATPNAPVRSITYAAGLLRKKGGTIVICGEYTPPYTGVDTYMPETSGTITSVYSGVDYAKTNGAHLGISARYLYLNGDYRFENLEIHSAASSVIVCNFHNVAFGIGIQSTVADPSDSAASNCTSVTGMNNAYGNCTLIINGGAFASNVFAVMRVGKNEMPVPAEIFGNVNLVLNGGSFDKDIVAFQDFSINDGRGNCILYLSDLMRSALDAGGFLGFSSIKSSADFMPSAAVPQPKTIVMTVGTTDAQMSGKAVSTGAAPLIVNDRVMLPALFIAENLGATVMWDGANSMVTITAK